jgi:hypothetical protein
VAGKHKLLQATFDGQCRKYSGLTAAVVVTAVAVSVLVGLKAYQLVHVLKRASHIKGILIINVFTPVS